MALALGRLELLGLRLELGALGLEQGQQRGLGRILGGSVPLGPVARVRRGRGRRRGGRRRPGGGGCGGGQRRAGGGEAHKLRRRRTDGHRGRGGRAAAVGGVADGAVHRGDELRPREEDDGAEREAARRGLVQRLLEQLDPERRGRLPDVVNGDPVGVEAERGEIAVELEHVGAVAVGGRQRPVRGRGAVHEEHGRTVDPEQRAAGLDLLPRARQPGDRAAQAVIHRLGVGVAERPRLGVGLDQVAPLDGRGTRRCLGGAHGARRRGGAGDEDEGDDHARRQREGQRPEQPAPVPCRPTQDAHLRTRRPGGSPQSVIAWRNAGELAFTSRRFVATTPMGALVRSAKLGTPWARIALRQPERRRVAARGGGSDRALAAPARGATRGQRHRAADDGQPRRQPDGGRAAPMTPRTVRRMHLHVPTTLYDPAGNAAVTLLCGCYG